MNISGTFWTAASPDALRTLTTRHAALRSVGVLREPWVDADGRLHAVVIPASVRPRMPFEVTIEAQHNGSDQANLLIRGRRAQHSLDVDLVVTYSPSAGMPGTEVSWTAALRPGGPAASVGQRIAGDLTARVITEVLVATADAVAVS